MYNGKVTREFFFSKMHVQRFILQNDFVIALIGGLSVDYRWD